MPLALAPDRRPLFPVSVKNKEGQFIELADPRATRAGLLLMNIHAVIGGAACHWGGPSALAELMSALHGLMFKRGGEKWFNSFHFVNDAGHAENGLYSLRANLQMAGLNYESLRGFRSITSHLTGHGELHLNPQGVLLSNGPLGSSVAQAQGLAFADKLQAHERTTIAVVSDGAAMEGETKEAFSAIPGIASKGKLNPFVMIISDNNTKLSGRIDKDSYSMAPTFQSLKVLGWEVLELADAHDLQKTFSALEQALDLALANPLRPVCLWAHTIKGKGLKLTEESSSGGHGYPFKKGDGQKIFDSLIELYGSESAIPEKFKSWAREISGLTSPPTPPSFTGEAPKKEKVQVGIAKAMMAAVKEGLPVVSITSDLAGSTGVASFHKEFPAHCYDVGVAESNMISMAVGLSKAGYIPVVDTFAQFGITKGNLPLIMASLSHAPVVAVFSHTGMQDAADGASHQATTYISALASIPHTQIIIVSCAAEAEELMLKGLKWLAEERRQGRPGENLIFFIGREDFPTFYHRPQAGYPWGHAQVLHQGKDLCLVASGPMLGEALLAAQWLLTQNIHTTVINHPFVNRVDANFFKRELERTHYRLATVEDHQVIGGMGALLAQSLLAEKIPLVHLCMGLNGEFGRSAYSAWELYRAQRLDGESLSQRILHWIS